MQTPMPRNSPYPIVLTGREQMRWKRSPVNIRHRIFRSSGPRRFSWRRKDSATTKSPNGFPFLGKLSASGASDFSRNAWRVWRTFLVPGARPFFPPDLVMQVKAMACELPSQNGQPLSRYSGSDLVREITGRGLVASISGRTVWRWLDQDAIRPWQHRSWIFPRDPQFQSKAERVLDLYQGLWEGQPLKAGDFVISADEKTSIQARLRLHQSLPPQPGQAMRVEFEYRARRRSGLSGRLGCASGQNLWPLRKHHWHQALWPVSGTSHGAKALLPGAPGLLDCG